MKEPFDYSIVPYTFGLCAAEECPRATTCLRHIALEYAPAERVFLSIMNHHRINPVPAVLVLKGFVHQQRFNGGSILRRTRNCAGRDKE